MEFTYGKWSDAVDRDIIVTKANLRRGIKDATSCGIALGTQETYPEIQNLRVGRVQATGHIVAQWEEYHDDDRVVQFKGYVEPALDALNVVACNDNEAGKALAKAWPKGGKKFRIVGVRRRPGHPRRARKPISDMTPTELSLYAKRCANVAKGREALSEKSRNGELRLEKLNDITRF